MLRAVDRWLPGYLRSCRRRSRVAQSHLLFCIADHFEPLNRTIGDDGVATGGNVPQSVAGDVAAWCDRYRDQFAEFHDSDGRSPMHTFFYPWDEYAPVCVEPLAGLTADGLAEVEVHLHHRHDTANGLREKLNQFRETLHRDHQLLGEDGAGRPRYGFVHGNWALANARRDGDWCGVNEELAILRETGCYADFTFPSAPSATQPRVVNSPYLAQDTGAAGAATQGRIISAGNHPEGLLSGVALPLITGPLGPNWSRRKWGLFPRLENGELSGVNPPDAGRLACWQRFQVHVPGRAEWTIIKLHTHGWVPANREMLLGNGMAEFHAMLTGAALRGAFKLHYVSGRELFNMVSAAAEGKSGDPNRYRDHVIQPPACRGAL
jgi:hypothetical protein